LPYDRPAPQYALALPHRRRGHPEWVPKHLPLLLKLQRLHGAYLMPAKPQHGAAEPDGDGEASRQSAP